MVRPHGGVVFKRLVHHMTSHEQSSTRSLIHSIEHDHFSYILVAPLLLVYDYMPGDVSTLDTCRRYGSCDVT